MSTRAKIIRVSSLVCALLGLAATCDTQPRDSEPVPAGRQQLHSSALVVSPDGARLYVTHPDADSVSLLDAGDGRVLRQQLLAADMPAPDAMGQYTPAVAPRALALSKAGDRLYVTGQRSGHVYVLDATTLAVQRDAFVCAEPIGVLLSADDASVFVACSQDDQVLQLSALDLGLSAKVDCDRKPWALAWAGQTLLATHLLGPGLSGFSTSPLALAATRVLADGVYAPDAGALDVPIAEDHSTHPHGLVRGIYAVSARPDSEELWVAHLMLGTDTAQPVLDFQRTVFPALSILDFQGTQQARLSVQTQPSDDAAIGDVVSGPHALTFSDDGKLAFVVDANSEDLLVIDTDQRVELQLVRPLPGHLPEAVAFSHGKVYVQERNSEDVAVFRVEQRAGETRVVQAGAAWPSLTRDPMPAELRLGQKLFYSANSDDVPTTQNHWMACASCHIEGRSDAVTWKFTQGPRDTPSNAGGLLDTGFLFRTADRTRVQDYWQTIDIEQGGHFSADEPVQQAQLDALAAYVNHAIPSPVPPSSDATHTLTGTALARLRAQGRDVFERLHCDGCHSGPALTDSGARNEALDLSGPMVSTAQPGGVLLHDVGTCVTEGDAPDVAHDDIAGHAREACAFDTPQLRGLWDSAPYLHDGSAPTLEATLPSMLRASAAAGAPLPELSGDDRRALLEYLRGL